MEYISLHTNVALLIDADRAEANYLQSILKLAEYYGELKLCRAYGDWEKKHLATWRKKTEVLDIEYVQIENGRKNASDHGLIFDAGRIAADDREPIGVFILVADDGDFVTLCRQLKETYHQVIVVGSDGASKDLQASCDEFHAYSQLADTLKQLEKRFPIPPREVRTFFALIWRAYREIAGKDWQWILLSDLGAKLCELPRNYSQLFGKYPLTTWLRCYPKEFQVDGERARKIDANPDAARESLLLNAYLKVKRPDDHRASLAELGNLLREIAPSYEDQFGGKKLSTWLKDYPDTFEVQGDYIIHTSYVDG